MPRLGETVTEGVIVKWLKKEGDKVLKEEPYRLWSESLPKKRKSI